MSRLLAAVLALCLAATTALAQVPAPSVHPGTKMTLGQSVGPAQFERSQSFPMGRETAYSYHYTANKMLITVYVYDTGKRVQAGSDNTAVQSHFTEEIQGLDRSLRSAGYTAIERPTVASVCNYGALSFRCIVYSAGGQSGRLYSKLMLTGYRDHFVKIRIDWSQAAGQTVADADQVLQSFISALMR
jgi:hypothetical protein